MTLEDTLFEEIRAGKQIEIERALLIVSGCGTEEKVSEYKAKLDELENGFFKYALERGAEKFAKVWENMFKEHSNERNAEEIGELLFDFLWRNKRSHKSEDKFQLTECINAQLGEDESIGNCLGLTSLYTLLGIRQGLNIKVIDSGPHIMPRLIAGERKIRIEATNRRGFDVHRCLDELRIPARARERDPIHLIYSMYNAQGTIRDREGRFEKGIQIYGKIIEMVPDYTSPYLNRAILRQQLGDSQGAKDDRDMYLKLRKEAL